MRDDSKSLAVAVMAAVLFVVLLSRIEAAKPPACPDGQCSYESTAVATTDLPVEMRGWNWGGGSCVHASNVHNLRQQGQDEMADWWRNNYSGGEYAERMNSRLEAAGVRYAVTTSGDVDLLEWCTRTRRWAGITYYPNHAINFCGFEGGNAKLLDNNRIEQYIYVPKDEFIRNWKNYGGWAWALVYTPVAPDPIFNSLFSLR